MIFVFRWSFSTVARFAGGCARSYESSFLTDSGGIEVPLSAIRTPSGEIRFSLGEITMPLRYHLGT